MLNSLTFTVAGLSLIVVFVYILKQKGIFSSASAPFVNSLLLNIILPANILHELMRVPLGLHEFKTALLFNIEIVILLILTYGFGKLMKYEKPVIGAFMLSTAFAATALIGLPLIKLLYPENARMQADAIIASEFGMIVPAFIFGPILAQIFGESGSEEDPKTLILPAIKKYLTSPIGIALMAGLVLSWLRLPADNTVVAFTEKVLAIMSSGLSLIPLVLLGLMLEVKSVRTVLTLSAAALVSQMMIEPYIASFLSGALSLSNDERQVVIILSLTPSALLTPAFALKYNCAPGICSAITFVCVVSTVIFLPLGYWLLGQ
ncbi:MAG: AEC family transporter [Ignavibacteriaceae bacterium]|nr:AEC family transporter [Ignavibacteriaceae bacterium]